VTPTCTTVSTVRRLIYVSCGFKSFQRDAVVLLGLSTDGKKCCVDSDDDGESVASVKWRLVHAEGHVMFPGSDHIEILAIFDRIVS
jgi:tRNA/tmRNA/rRNA uracil-C5-methylase (TrmA/RlmC/RlmD family)